MLKKKVKYIVGRLRYLVHGIKWGGANIYWKKCKG